MSGFGHRKVYVDESLNIQISERLPVANNSEHVKRCSLIPHEVERIPLYGYYCHLGDNQGRVHTVSMKQGYTALLM